ncbi:MAG: D-2-hydroxyacid dehydrogenase [Faecalibacterium sp.]|nr:D-2-hydroxyacid dehydrogenase [Ruminococcus sp.]MCM1486591.1 D-2-hydroxyacid dehydrogenase [Faecalibacterium sp.]
MKLVILDSYTSNPGDLSWDWLKNEVDEYEIYQNTSPELVIERSIDADILVTNKVPITREIIEALPKLKYIAVLATGYNIIDCTAAREHGISVSNIPAYSTDGVAQLVFALLFELVNQVGLHNQSVKNGDWAASEYFCYWKTPLIELAGKTFGIIGFGKIGSAVAQIANALKMNVIAYSPNTRTYDGFGSVRFAALDEVITQSDVISLHCPLTEQTNGLVNKDFLAKMKSTAYIINTSRGPVLNEEDVADALNNNQIAGIGVDVLSDEPPTQDNPLINAKNSFITPHIAWASHEARSRLMGIFRENVKGFVNGKAVNVVN